VKVVEPNNWSAISPVSSHEESSFVDIALFFVKTSIESLCNFTAIFR